MGLFQDFPPRGSGFHKDKIDGVLLHRERASAGVNGITERKGGGREGCTVWKALVYFDTETIASTIEDIYSNTDCY